MKFTAISIAVLHVWHFLRKFLLVMKLTSLLLIISLVQVGARGYSQITLKERNASFEKVLSSIEKQSGYVFLYDEEQLELGKISIEVNNASIKETLEKCFKGLPVAYQIVDKNITLKRKGQSLVKSLEKLLALPINVTGRVVDSAGRPLPGITVKLKGSKRVSITNANGDFSMPNVEDDGTLVFSAIGMAEWEEKINGRNVINITLIEKSVSLEATVVTGIFERKANSYTGSTLTVRNADLRKVGNANLFQALKNISPSLFVDNFSMGSNPNTLPDMQLRGTSTFPSGVDAAGLKGNYLKSPNEPLFILDGFETTAERIFDLDINRIELVTILKDAASKAIYGSRAANGVIVIETKKLASSKALVSYNASVDIELPDLSSYNLTNALEKLEAERIDGMYNSTTPENLVSLQQLYNARKKTALEGLDTYWLAKPLQDGVGQKHTLTVELGGNQDLNVVGDVSYRDVRGVMIGSGRKNVSGNVSASYRVKNLLFRNIISATNNNNSESPYGTFSEYAMMNPYWRAENADGSIPLYAEVGPTGALYTNPLYNSTTKTRITSNYFNFTDNFYLEWTIIPGLKATTRAGIDVKRSGADEFYPASHTKFAVGAYTTESYKQRRGSYQVNNGKSSYVSGDFNINYSKEIGRNFYFANGGFNMSERRYNEVIHLVEGFSSDRMDNIMFGRAYALDSRPTGLDGINRDIGFLGAFSYMYDNRFLTDLTVRTSASSQFGADRRWATFWSFGLGWNLHREKFLHNADFLKQLKIRGSVGSTGNQNFPTNASVATYAYYLESLYQGFPGSYLLNMANPDLQWESKFDYNAGLDAIVGGLSLKFDYYQSYTENLVTDITTSNSTGFILVKDNLGKVKNTGIELYGSWRALSKGRNFLSLNFGLETNRNKIVSLSDAMKSYNARMDQIAANQSTNTPVKKYQDGMSMNAIWAVPSLGIDPATGNEIYVKRDGSTTFIWDANDMVVAGNSNPDYQGTLGFTAEYKGIGLSVTGRYLGGGQMYNQTLVDKVENVDMLYNVDSRVLSGRWLEPGQNALFKRLGNYSADLDGDGSVETSLPAKTRATSRFVQNRNELNVAAVNLYYLFDQKVSKQLGFQRLKLGFNMNEIATFSSIRIERGTLYPFARTMSFSLSATFK
ncbi:SusC/RagA family TonB-linked outer membrane protein [Arcticibacter tournemirensis]|uniref:SusC/RagA family TonB-linked outer membrane protein n=2 Tax=Arcticibacter tournemirensis TaxID=699437 RepID=A0A4Q0M9A0_9SPHI|nr:SusC/RagA family TonB-linked outer membrane protein [Arcticibacter tournemirensis]